MRRTKMVLAVVGLMIAMFVVLAAPAMANDNDNHHKNNDNDKNHHHNRFFDHDDDDDDEVRFVFRDDFFDDDFRNRRFDFGFDSDLDQDAESGDVDQSFDVSQTGDNSNETVGIQGVANTGNAQNQIGVIDAGGFGDFEFEDVGSTIEVSPTNTVTSDQEVNQAAAAFGHKGWW